VSAEQKIINFKVRGELAGRTVPIYSNFLAVSQLGNEVQFEFIFLDLNLVANFIEQFKAGKLTETPEVEGKTVAKMIMPAGTFLQLKEQFDKIFKTLENTMPTNISEVQNEERRSSGGKR
jgi:hypothetical protein